MTGSSASGDASDSEPRQFEILRDVRRIPVMAADGDVRWHETPHGVAIVTQCCDLARGGKGLAHLSPLCELSADEIGSVRSGRSPRYIELPEIEGLFVDLGIIASANQELLQNYPRDDGCSDEWQRHKVRSRVGRRFSRYALPDELVGLLAPLQKKLREKARRGQSNLGRVLETTLTARLEVIPGIAEAYPWEVSVLFILDSRTVPAEDPGETSDRGLTVDAAADLVLRADLLSSDMATAWNQLCHALLRETATSRPPADIIGSFDITYVQADDFSYERFQETVSLDLDDLSDPTDQ